jgi:hypothetical protein
MNRATIEFYMKIPSLVSLILLTLAAGARGAGDDFSRTNINPALLYYQAFLAAPEPWPEADWKYLGSAKGVERKMPERFGGILEKHDYQFHLVRQAVRSEVACDWGLELSLGPATHLPHLARAKAIAQTALIRGRWALEQKRQDQAREDLLAAFVLGRRLGSDQLFISALVQDVIENMIYWGVAQHFGEISPESLRELLAGFDGTPARCTMAACVPVETRWGYDWMVAKIMELRRLYPGDDGKVMAGFKESGFAAAMNELGYGDFWAELLPASGGTSEGVLKLLRETEPLFPRLGTLMALPQPEYESAAKTYSAEVAASRNPFFRAHGFFVEKFKLRLGEFRAQAYSEMVRAAIGYRLNGEAGLNKVMDPFGNGPFAFRRFQFKGVDRGFELRSAYAGMEAPLVLIFVEKQGPAFQISGPNVGKAVRD